MCVCAHSFLQSHGFYRESSRSCGCVVCWPRVDTRHMIFYFPNEYSKYCFRVLAARKYLPAESWIPQTRQTKRTASTGATSHTKTTSTMYFNDLGKPFLPLGNHFQVPRNRKFTATSTICIGCVYTIHGFTHTLVYNAMNKRVLWIHNLLQLAIVSESDSVDIHSTFVR